MNRKSIAQETVAIIKQGYYETAGQHINIQGLQSYSQENSKLITPEKGADITEALAGKTNGGSCPQVLWNKTTVEAILTLRSQGKENIGVLNFASAKNPGGGFLNGAMAQEESLAASGGLYGSLVLHEGYYQANRACGHMVYTNHAIYSPEVVFFRDKQFEFIPQPVTASVLTLPAVNYGQVILKGENTANAKTAMKDRMRLALALFADNGCKHIILGAYGCGVFRNDPTEVAIWWKELLEEECWGSLFTQVVFAVYDISKKGMAYQCFETVFGSKE